VLETVVIVESVDSAVLSACSMILFVLEYDAHVFIRFRLFLGFRSYNYFKRQQYD